MIKLGKKILDAATKAYPYLTNGTQNIAKNSKFSLKNPYILETLPDDAIKSLSIFEGKKLNSVCRIIDDPNYTKIAQRYKNFCSTYANKGFNDAELSLLYKKAFPNIKVPSDCNIDAMVFLSKLDPKIGMHFDAHGIAKISITDQLKQLNNFLTKGINPEKALCTAPLAAPKGLGAALGTAGSSAYRDGSFIIISGKGKTLCKDGIENVIVNDAYYSIINDLKSKFPNVNFVKAENATEYFTKLGKI